MRCKCHDCNVKIPLEHIYKHIYSNPAFDNVFTTIAWLFDKYPFRMWGLVVVMFVCAFIDSAKRY